MTRDRFRTSGIARIELEDGTLLEGTVVEVAIETDTQEHTSPYGGVSSYVVTERRTFVQLTDTTTTPGWRQHHDAGEDMGVPITLSPTAPEAPELESPEWGTWS
ncbi:hypothetical protein [Methylorubrum extorquens]|uniref:hypothetical protein n=1 Tax=Methylorubrum extorquens TaxID=408 RepID=UPI00209F18D1|nr:hypothetical protein [Methylorubrum extorquens]MCP1539992.1 hypothetical protein [Methylorubrum extorquens]